MNKKKRMNEVMNEVKNTYLDDCYLFAFTLSLKLSNFTGKAG